MGGEADKIWQELGRGNHNQNIVHEKNKEKRDDARQLAYPVFQPDFWREAGLI